MINTIKGNFIENIEIGELYNRLRIILDLDEVTVTSKGDHYSITVPENYGQDLTYVFPDTGIVSGFISTLKKVVTALGATQAEVSDNGLYFSAFKKSPFKDLLTEAANREHAGFIRH